MMSLLANFSFAQEWTNQEFETANTAKDFENLASEEKEVFDILILQDFIQKSLRR